ncbi:hypothetical protein [Lonepinella sp. BR2357]|uniref:hypothetical protein n=2 Tax=Lonepinella TaxID=53416 RepID=UPI003F6E0DA3
MINSFVVSIFILIRLIPRFRKLRLDMYLILILIVSLINLWVPVSLGSNFIFATWLAFMMEIVLFIFGIMILLDEYDSEISIPVLRLLSYLIKQPSWLCLPFFLLNETQYQQRDKFISELNNNIYTF